MRQNGLMNIWERFSIANRCRPIRCNHVELTDANRNVTEIFKTPGKLRGKTPRTARQRSPERAVGCTMLLTNRQCLLLPQPLTEIFSADKRYNQSPSRVQVPAKELKLTSPKSFEEQFPTITKITRPPHDSVYHGSTEDQMEIDHVECNIQVGASEQKKQDEVQDKRVSGEDRTATEGSFHSARENLTTRDVIMIDVGRDTPILDDIPGSFPKDPLLPAVSVIQEGTIPTSVTSQDEINEEISNDIQESSRSSSVGSSPPKPLVRKSSLTFAALPAREPLGTKKSIGNQGSRISNSDGIKGPINRSSYLGRYTCGKSLGGAKPAENDDMEIDNDQEKEPETQMHNKDATQRLHDRINLLGKTQPSRTTKSVASQQLTYPDLSANSQEGYAIEKNSDKTVKMATDPSVGEEDDWILSTAVKGNTPERPTLSKSRSMDVMEQIIGKENISGIGLGLAPGETEISKQQSPLKYNPAHGYDSPRMYTKAASTVDLSTTTYQPPGPQNAISVSNPAFLPIVTTTTPAGSPSSSKFHIDGHLSASKHKLQSIMKSARGLFSSSAKVSNQAKIETMSPSKQKLRNPAVHSGLQDFSKIQTFTQSTYPNVYSESVRAESPSKVRKTRSSTEKERELKKQEREVKEREKQEADLTRARELERQKATKFQENPKVTLSIISLVSKSSLEETSKPIRISPRRLAALNKPLPPINIKVEVTATSATSQSQIAQPSKTLQPPRRPVRPAVKDNTLPKVKQPPVSIRIGPLLNRAPINGSSVPSSQEEPAPPVPAKPMVKPGSTISRQTNASTASLKSSLSSNTSKARIPITRKIERKPTAQEEAQKRIAERVAATEEAKKAAYRQALERKQMLGHNQPHVGGSSFNVKPSHLSKARLLQNGKTTSNQAQRGQGNLKTIPYANTTTESSRPPTAMSTKGKRHLDDTDEEGPRPIKPAPGQSYQQTDTKRRRTGESDIAEQPVIRPAMAAPIRNSNIRKVGHGL